MNPLIDLTPDVTRQDLFDMWNGALSNVGLADFAEGFIPIIAASSFSSAPASPQPGQLLWHMSENLMYVWTDVLEGTGVSLWLAIGPDKFETACLTTEDIGAGHPVELLYDRYVRHDRTHEGLSDIRAMPRTFGFNQSGIDNPVEMNQGPPYGGDTASSGTWIRVGVDGFVYGALEDQASHPTDAWNRSAGGFYVFLSDVIGIKPTLLFAQGEPLVFNTIGMNTFHPLAPASAAAVTEPSYILKFLFMPRVARQNDFAD